MIYNSFRRKQLLIVKITIVQNMVAYALIKNVKREMKSLFANKKRVTNSNPFPIGDTPVLISIRQCKYNACF